MRESNFAFPAQNKACVCITSQLYDRRALDTTSALPLFNSLTHLTYLTSTSPRIREIMTMDGGLERLVRILHDFCMCPPPPENPTLLYGLTPPTTRPPKLTPTLNPTSFDKQSAYRFSLAFQCVVNIGVRGSEPIRSRVVQAGTLDVVGCILEAWLANKGFAVGPSSSATGIPRETREQRQARRDAQQAQRHRDQATQLTRELHRQIQLDHLQQRSGRQHQRLSRAPESSFTEDDYMDVSPSGSGSNDTILLSASTSGPSASSSDNDMSTDASTAATPVESGTPTGSVVIPSRDRSGTIIARPVWDPTPQIPTATTTINPNASTTRHRSHRHRNAPSQSPNGSTSTSRPDTDTETDGDVDGDIDMDRMDRRLASGQTDSEVEATSASPSPEPHPRPHPHARLSLSRRAVGIVSDDPPAGEVGNMDMGTMELSADAHIIINDAGVGGVGDGGVGVEDGIVSLEPNDDFAMGAPPGAPGAIDEGATPRGLNLEGTRRRNGGDPPPDITPRAGVVNLPTMGGGVGTGGGRTGTGHHQRNATVRTRTNQDVGGAAAAAGGGGAAGERTGRTNSSGTHHGRDTDAGPYRDEDVLLSLQLLAYLSKYPHVRQAFYKQRKSFHPASVNLPGPRYGVGAGPSGGGSGETAGKQKEKAGVESYTSSPAPVKEQHGFFRALTSGRGKEKEREREKTVPLPPIESTVSPIAIPSAPKQTNVFSLVERFTFKPSSTETEMPNPPPRLPPEIQYWAGVIMRNACRKDDSRGGIRQCANMLCGRWESYPREFAKCRRCRKAKYCGKECQSTAWSEGHRFWCSAKDGDDDATGEHPPVQAPPSGNVSIAADESMEVVIPVGMTAGGTVVGRTERRERHARERAQGTVNGGGARSTGGFRAPAVVPVPSNARGEGSAARDRERVVPQAPVSRTRGIDVRSRVAALNNVSGANYLTFDMFSEPSGRRRAETVADPMTGPATSGEASAHSLYQHTQPPSTIGHPFATGPTAPIHSTNTRPEAGPSRRRRGDNGFRLPAEDHDMVLG